MQNLKPFICLIAGILILIFGCSSCATKAISPKNEIKLHQSYSPEHSGVSIYKNTEKPKKCTGVMKESGNMIGNIARLKWMKCAKNMYRMKYIRAGMVEHFVKVENGTVHFWTGGEGEPLMMMHGFGTGSEFQLKEQVKPLGKKYFLILPDLMWFGESYSEKEDYSIDFQAETLEQLMDSMSIEKFHLMGLSLGGMVASVMAINNPNRVQKLVIVDSPVAPYLFTMDESLVIAERMSYSPVDALVPSSLDGVRFLMQFGYHKPPKAPNFVLKDALKYLRQNLKQRIGIAKYIEENAGNLFTNTGYNITQETLVLGAEYSFMPVEAGKRIAERIGKNATYKMVTDSAHQIMDDNPEEFNQFVLEFLQGTLKESSS